MIASTAVARPVSAQESNAAPLLGVRTAVGARGGWGGPDEAIAGGGLFAGARWGAYRVGVLGAASWWRENPGVAVDVGAFGSADIGAIWLDPELSAAWFVRVEPGTFRRISSNSRWAYAPSLEIGARAAGVEVGVAGTLEVGIEDLPNAASRLGVDVELRLGVDFVELARLCQHIGASNEPLAP